MNPIYIPKNRRPLSRVSEGEKVIVKEVNGGRGINLRLCELGIGVGSSMTVVQKMQYCCLLCTSTSIIIFECSPQ